MRVAYLHQYFTTPDGASGTRSYELARRLVRMGHEVHMITSTAEAGRRGWAWRESEVAGLRVHAVPVPYENAMSNGRRTLAFAEFAARAAERARRVRPDVVYATSTPLTIALPGAYAARLSGAPMVFEVRDLWPEVPIAVGALRRPWTIALARWLERFAYGHSASVVALSPGMRDGVVAAGVDPERVAVIPNACDFDVFDVDPRVGKDLRSRHAWLGDRPLVVYLGTLGRINGVEYLAEVAGACRRVDRSIRFAVVGAGACAGEVREAARRHGVLDETFFMFAKVPKREAAAWLSAASLSCSLFIDLPEVRSNSANKVFDALAARRPVAINHEGWLADLLRADDAGIVWPAVARDVVPDDVCGLVNDRERLARMGAAAHALGRARFDRDAHARQLEAILVRAARR